MKALALLGLKRERFTLTSPLSPQKLHARLAEAVEAPSWKTFFRMPKRPFVGHVAETSFRLLRTEGVRGRRIDARPRIVGRVRRQGSATLVDVELKPRAMAVGHMLFWYAALLVITAIGIDGLMDGDPMDKWARVEMACLLLLGAGWLANHLASDRERRSARERLEAVTEAKEAPATPQPPEIAWRS